MKRSQTVKGLSLAGWELTIDHPASSYGMPVYIYKDREYGPADRIPRTSSTAADLVHAWAIEKGRTDEEKALAGKFLRQWPEGPQLKHVPGVMGRPRKFGKSRVIGVRLPEEIIDKLPLDSSERAKWMRAAVADKLNSEGR